MVAQVTVLPSRRRFTVEAHETLLDAAMRQAVGLPYGCRDGACGACKAKLRSGEVSLDGYQEKTLSGEERERGIILLCCAYPQSDLEIEVPNLISSELTVKTLPCRVETLIKRDQVAILRLKLAPSEPFLFQAGQYIDILMKDGKSRSYSIANPPYEKGYLELHIRYQAGGAFAEYVFNSLKERDILRFKGPLGGFYLQNTEKPKILIASGTGFAPVKSMIQQAIYEAQPYPITLYWGGREQRDLYELELARSWLAQHPTIRFIPVLSDSPVEAQWSGRTGLVHEAIMADFADLSDYEVYACGAPAMVAAAHHDLTQQRYLSSDAFFSDAFFGAADLKSTTTP